MAMNYGIVYRKLERLRQRMKPEHEYYSRVAGFHWSTNTVKILQDWIMQMAKGQNLDELQKENWAKHLLSCNDLWKQVNKRDI